MKQKVNFPLVAMLIILSGVLLVVFILQYDFTSEIKKYHFNPVEVKTNCSDLEGQIKNMIDEINYCDTDNDCVVESRYSCPFGCYQLFNKEANLSIIDKKVKEINDACVLCEYECTVPPVLSEIKCIDSKCMYKLGAVNQIDGPFNRETAIEFAKRNRDFIDAVNIFKDFNSKLLYNSFFDEEEGYWEVYVESEYSVDSWYSMIFDNQGTVISQEYGRGG